MKCISRELDVVEILAGSWGGPLLRRGPWHESLRYRYITQLAEPYAPVIDNKLGKSLQSVATILQIVELNQHISVTGQLYDFVSEGKIEKETIIEYSSDEGETFIALVFMDDENDVTVSQETWHAFLDTSFNGDLRDNFEFLNEHFAWPEDLKQCSVTFRNDNLVI